MGRRSWRYVTRKIKMNELKKILFESYGGFADKRIKSIAKSNRFIIDDRSDSDVGSNGKLYSYFCMIFAEVKSNQHIAITLLGNVPEDAKVESWLKKNDCEIKTPSHQSRLEIDVKLGEQSKLDDLAVALKSIVSPDAPRYEISNYKYVCPRTSKALNRFSAILSEAWSKELSSKPEGFFY